VAVDASEFDAMMKADAQFRAEAEAATRQSPEWSYSKEMVSLKASLVEMAARSRKVSEVQVQANKQNQQAMQFLQMQQQQMQAIQQQVSVCSALFVHYAPNHPSTALSCLVCIVCCIILCLLAGPVQPVERGDGVPRAGLEHQPVGDVFPGQGQPADLLRARRVHVALGS